MKTIPPQELSEDQVNEIMKIPTATDHPMVKFIREGSKPKQPPCTNQFGSGFGSGTDAAQGGPTVTFTYKDMREAWKEGMRYERYTEECFFTWIKANYYQFREVIAESRAAHASEQEKWTVTRELYTATLRDSRFSELLRLSLTQDVDLQRVADARNATLQHQSDDTKRLDWLEAMKGKVSIERRVTTNDWAIYVIGWEGWIYAPTLRESIDAAMSQEKEKE